MPDGNVFSIEFLKFTKRILSYFPIFRPDNNATDTDDERSMLCSHIEFSLKYIKDVIMPFLSKKASRDNINNDLVSREELTYLWSTQHKRVDVLFHCVIP